MLLCRFLPLWLSASVLFGLSPGGTTDILANLPLHFERNGSRFEARTNQYKVELEASAAVVSIRRSHLRITFPDSLPTAPTGLTRLAGVSNYFDGIQPSKWRKTVEHYSRVRYPQIYSGIDLDFYGTGKFLEYDFVIAPHANPAGIRFRVEGGGDTSIAGNGDLLVRTSSGDFTLRAPIAYQHRAGKRERVASRFHMENDTVSFRLGKYDPNRTLVIDPVIVFSSYLGGSDVDAAAAMTLDAQNNIYLTGYTRSLNFPAPAGTTQPFAAVEDVFLMKLNPAGTQILFATFIGGRNSERPVGIAVDPLGNVVIAGNTNSPDFPHSSGGFEEPGSAMFVSRFGPDGSLLASNFFGDSGPGALTGLAIDGQGNVYLCGFTSDVNFVTTEGAIQAAKKLDYDGFVAKMSPALGAVVYSTLLGGDGADRINAITVDSAGNAYVTGETTSANFPVTAGAFASVNRGGADVFVSGMNATGTLLNFSAILAGTADDYGQRIALGPGGNIFVAGLTLSSNYPVTQGAFQFLRPQFATAAFLTKLNAAGSAPFYSTYFGAGSSYFDVRAITQVAVDGGDNAYLAGYGFGNGMPTTPGAAQAPGPGLQDGFLTRFASAGDILTYGTYIGGAADDAINAMAVDSTGSVYLAGSTTSSNFPVLASIQPAYGGITDAFVMKFDLSSSTSGCSYSLSAATFTTDSLATEASFTLTTGAGCPWTVTSNQTWTRITSAASGAGNTTVVFQVEANGTAANRTATISIGGRSFAITQNAAPCLFSVDPPNRALPASGGSLNFVVSTLPGCSWTAASNAPWLRLTGGTTGAGTGLTPMTFDENTNAAPRTGSLTIARQGIHMVQPAAVPQQAYTDVPLSNIFADHIFLMKHNGIADSCNGDPATFCPDGITTRAMMAYFIIKATQPENFTYTTRPYFGDVPASHPMFSYIQKMRDLGYTVGCTQTDFCPNLAVTRSQMATFIIRARLNVRSGQTFTFTSLPYFSDVPSTDLYFAFVQKMRELGITSGCTLTTYCGSGETTRGQMAVFVIRGLKTP